MPKCIVQPRNSKQRQDGIQAIMLHTALFRWFCSGQGNETAKDNAKLKLKR